MRLIDEHWIAYPKLIAGDLDFLERAKLNILGRPVVRYLDVILARRPRGEIAACGVSEVLVIPGGGTGHPGAEDAAKQFLSAAKALSRAGFATTFVGPAQSTAQAGARFSQVEALPQVELADLMRSARLIVANGGSTMLQAIACGAACVAAPIARDQHERIRRCVEAGIAVEAAPIAAEILRQARALLEDEPARTALVRRAAELGLADGLEVALAALESFRSRH
jgi:UDP:flavonoid glycosyltransferase YjiC (YdhE family)